MWVRFRPFLLFLAASAVAIIVLYSRALSGGFIFDDLSTVAIATKTNFLSLARFFDQRGVAMATFTMNYRFWSTTAGYHLVGILFHILATWLVFGLVYSLALKEKMRQALWLAVLVASLFAVHPIQTSAVSYISQRLAVIAACFYVGALLLYVQYRLRQHWGWLAGALAAAFLVMFTKENAITLPMVIVLLEGVFLSCSWRELPRRWKTLTPFLLTMLIIPTLQLHMLPWAGGHSGSFSISNLQQATQELPTTSRLNYARTEINVVTTYLGLLVWPAHQMLDYDYPVAQHWSLGLTAKAVLLLVITGAGLALLYYGYRLPGFGILFFFLALAVESSFIPIKDVIFEHRLYLPSFGIFLASGYVVILVLSRYKVAVWGVSVALLVVLGGLSYQRNILWGDPIKLWADNVANASHKARPHNNLGVALASAGQFPQAIAAYQTAIRLDPNFADPHTNLGAVYGQLGQFDQSINELKQALAIDPTLATPRNNLGSAYLQMGRVEDSIAEFKKGLEIDPESPDLRANLARAYMGAQRYEEAVALFEGILKEDPTNAVIHTDLGAAYYQTGHSGWAKAEFERALEIDPTNPLAQRNLQLLNQQLYGGIR